MTEEILSTACELAGFPADDARLLRAHSNTVYLLPSTGVVARVNGNDHAGLRAKASLTLTRWLADNAVPVTEAAFDRAVEVAGSTVTFWIYYPQLPGRERPTARHLAGILRRLHALPAPPFPLPDYEPLIGLTSILAADETAAVLSGTDRRWLNQQAQQAISEYRGLPTVLGRGMVHGDAYAGNTLWSGDTVLLGDWDEAAIAPRELDLANTVQSRRFGARETDIDGFLRIYGHDPRDIPLFGALVRMRDLHTLTSYIRRAQRGDGNAHTELTTRIRSLRDPAAPARWKSS
ncbi:phosphotransferase [Nocardia carnea]|uniref:phosphotransferase n=1 Tax=Nocardia carnea TaxID=37328 RepID=UPI0006870B6A|nr:aminoglycoside phosphotransferase family protein [Nocardia carnea]